MLGRKIIFFSVIITITALFSCDSNQNALDQPQPIVPTALKVAEYIDGLIDNKSLVTSTINRKIDSLQVVGEIEVRDSVNKYIYLAVLLDDQQKVYPVLQTFFNEKYGKVLCAGAFCSWRFQPSKQKKTEVLLMDESIEKKQPYIALEIEEIHER